VNFLAGHRTENVDFWSHARALSVLVWLLGSPDTDIVSVHLATDVGCEFIGDQSLYGTIFLHFQLHLLVKFTPTNTNAKT
jgi:hypothetical protein